MQSKTTSLSLKQKKERKKKELSDSNVALKAAVRAYKHNQPALTFDPVYLHVSSSTRSCHQAATSVLACSAAENQTGSDITSVAPWVEQAADGWKEEVDCVSFSFSGCGSDVPDSVVLFKGSQTNKNI